MKVQVAKWGNSLAVRLPKRIADELSLKAGQTMEVAVKGRAVEMLPDTPAAKAPNLTDMLDEIERLGLTPSPLLPWDPDRGSEIIDDDYSRGIITLEDILKKRDAAKGR